MSFSHGLDTSVQSYSRKCYEWFNAVASIPIAGYHQHEEETGKGEVRVGRNPTALRFSRAMQLPLLVPPGASQLAALETKGVVYTKRWVVELLLDLAGYRSEANLVDAIAVEPAAGNGAFLGPMIERLTRDRDAEPDHVGKVRQAHPSRRVFLA